MRINLLLVLALACGVCTAQQYGDRLTRQSKQNNGYFYPEPSPTFTLPPPTPPPTQPPPTQPPQTLPPQTQPPPTAPAVVQTTAPPADYLPPPTQPSYVQCSQAQTCVPANVCSGQGSSSTSGNCQINGGGQVGVCCNPPPTTTTTTTTTTPTPYVQCIQPQECLSAQVCSSRGSTSSNTGSCRVNGNGQIGVCCNPAPTTTTTTTTTTRAPTTTTRPATAPVVDYLPPVTTTEKYSYPEPDDPLQFPDSNNEKPFVAVTVKAPPPPTPTTPRPTAPPTQAVVDDEIAFWDFRESIPGDPETDYPILDKIPQTSFTCGGKVDGFYADVDTRCQVFHVCSNIPNSDPIKSSFLCPNGTIFNQQSFVCQWWPDVECASSSQFFKLNEEIGKVPAASSSSGSQVRAPGGSTSAISSASVAQPQQTGSQQPSLSISAAAFSSSQPEY